MFDPYGASHLAGVLAQSSGGGGPSFTIVAALCAAVSAMAAALGFIGRTAYTGERNRADRLEKVVLDMLPVMESTRASNAEVAKSNAAIVVSLSELAKVVSQIGDRISELAGLIRGQPR